MIKGIAHLCIRVVDLEKTSRFYCDGLGLGKAFDFIRDGKVVGFYLRVGNGNYLEFFQREPVEAGIRAPSIISAWKPIRSTKSTPGSPRPAMPSARRRWEPTTPGRPG